MSKLKILAAGAAFAALCSLSAWAGSSSVPMMMQSAVVTPPPPTQVVSSISPSSCAFTQGTAGNCSISVTLQPPTPTFSADGGTLSLVSSNALCPGTNDTTDFGVGNSPYQIIYNGAAAAGNYNTCVQASGKGISPGYKQVAITVSNTPGGTITPPDIATNAGFGTVALNLDFTGATSSNFGSTAYTATNISSWLDCAGASNPIFFTAINGANTAPCSDITIANDPTVGKNVLSLLYTSTDLANGVGGTGFQLENGSGNPPVGNFLPVTGVREVVFRIVQNPNTLYNISSGCTSGSGSCPEAVDWWSIFAGCCNGVEIDFLELWYPFNNTTSAVLDWSDNNAGGPTSPQDFSSASGYDITQYHTYTTRVTGDGSSNNATCQWLDGVSLGCSDWYSGYFATPWYTQQENLLFYTGPYYPQGVASMNSNEQIFVQRITDYECSAWQSGYCWGTVLGSCGVGQTTPC